MLGCFIFFCQKVNFLHFHFVRKKGRRVQKKRASSKRDRQKLKRERDRKQDRERDRSKEKKK